MCDLPRRLLLEWNELCRVPGELPDVHCGGVLAVSRLILDQRDVPRLFRPLHTHQLHNKHKTVLHPLQHTCSFLFYLLCLSVRFLTNGRVFLFHQLTNFEHQIFFKISICGETAHFHNKFQTSRKNADLTECRPILTNKPPFQFQTGHWYKRTAKT